ncbi:hydrogenase expression/formation protein [Azorhizobium caulinodans ORS 571]|uniref:Hydrogenase expression/formation protein n=2 Tax=Azorhizobium caulinodans TaxID=7 RepID=A8IMS7_AZOC5|nr:hydrogenase [Azorhizobium caulinodans]AAS91031.1 HupG [Azorhizobium caulinodans ORS 571]BAF86601.1 hydrogenase expression/formation protein [Azorhizobium caulinodans ORS 571]
MSLSAATAPAPLPHPLVERLVITHGYSYADALSDLDGEPRDLLLFLPSHGKPHLETPDIAAVLPELVKSLNGTADRLSAAIAGPALELELRQQLQLALPALVVVRAGTPIGSVARMRDWDEYLARLSAVLGAATH